MHIWRQVPPRSERGQMIVLMTLLLFWLLGMAGLAIDVGRIYKTRVELVRAVDAGALAGVQEFPNMTKARTSAINFVMLNEPQAQNITAGPHNGDTTKLQVQAKKSVSMTFLSLFGVKEVSVSGSSVAGTGNVPIDLVLAMDTTGSMGFTANKMPDAKNAANSLVNMLMGSGGQTQTGVVPFNYCFNSGGTRSAAQLTNSNGSIDNSGFCADVGRVVGLTSNKTTVTNRINSLSPRGYTNTCEGLVKARDVINGAAARTGPNIHRAIILLSDGGNTLSDMSTTAACRATPNRLVTNATRKHAFSGDCYPREYMDENQAPEGGEIDRLTYAVAQDLKSQGIEIYVVALEVCGPDTTEPCNTGLLGVIPHTKRALNLLKCVATSAPGTNDHFFFASNSSQLQTIFSTIGGRLATRLIE